MAESQAVAKQALKKLEDQLTCAICLDAFKDPKLLQCFHVYCKDCLQRLVVTDRQGQLSLRCPTCRQSTLLPPATSVSDLQPAFHIHHLFEIQDALEKVKQPQKVLCTKCNKNRSATSYCRDCGKYICASCTTVHSDWDDFAEHEVVALEQLESKVKQLDSLKKVILYCSLHKGKELELYCEMCEELICHNCTVKKHCRPEHKYDLVDDTFEKHKAEMVASLDPIENQLGIVNKALEQIEQRSGDVNEQREATKTGVQRIVQQLHEMLEACKTKLIGKIDEYADQKVKNLAAQKDEVETVQTQLVSCLSFVRESLRTGSQGEVMKMKKTVMKQIKEMTDNFKPGILAPCEAADVRFVSSPKLAEACQQFGEVYVGTCKVSPEKCYVVGKGVKSAEMGERATAVLHLVSDTGKACSMEMEGVLCEFVSVATAATTKCLVKAIEAGQYEISYQPTSRGRHQLHIKVEGEHIKGSPFPVTVKMPVKKLGTTVRVISGLNSPWGVAINQHREEIIVAENGSNCVSIFSSMGVKLRSFGSWGELSGPRGVAVDDDGNILVVDSGHNRIQKFTSNGAFVRTVGKGTVNLYNSIGVSIHPKNKRVIISDHSNNRVHILNPDLTFNSSFGGRGTNPGQTNNPYEVAFDSVGNIYQGGHSSTCVQVFNAEGQFLRKFGNQGNGQGQLNFPSGIAISDDVVYVAEHFNNRISIFTTEGAFLTSFGTHGKGQGQFSIPMGIAVDSDGFLYVCDNDNGRVQIF